MKLAMQPEPVSESTLNVYVGESSIYSPSVFVGGPSPSNHETAKWKWS